MRCTVFGFLAIALASPSLALAQAPAGAPRPGPVESAPLPPPGAPSAPQADPAPGPSAPSGGPAAPVAPPLAQPATPPSSSPPGGRATLVPDTGDQDVAEVTLPAKPAAIISGSSGTDEGFANVRNAIRRVEEELTKAGIAPTGRPFTIFQQFNPDGSFTYDVLVPIAQLAEGRATLTPDIRFGTTPAGRALRFVHKGPYDDVDSTYDMIEVYLEAKGIVVKDPIIEEYVNEPKDAADPELELNIFVQPQ